MKRVTVQSLLVLWAIRYVSMVHCKVVNMATMEKVDYTWIESGFTYTSSETWVRVETIYSNFQNAVILLSAATIYNQDDDFQPISPIMKIVSGSGRVAFDVRISMPNCSSQWWTPIDVADVLVNWIVAEKGGYKVTDTQIVVGSALISRQPAKIEWPFTFGSSCNNPKQDVDDDYMPGAIMTLQTLNNVNQLVYPRVTSAWYKSELNVCQYSWKYGSVFLKSPDSSSNNVAEIMDETLGYFVFDIVFNTLLCVGDTSLLELGSVSLTSSYWLMTYSEFHEISNMGIFGMPISYNGGDLAMLRSIKYQASLEFSVYLQEDQCEDEEVEHRPENVSYALVSTTANCSWVEAVPHTTAPTLISTEAPMHRHDKEKNMNNVVGTVLAVVLPILILGVVAVVGFFARYYFLADKGLIDSMDESNSRSSTGLV